MLQKTVFTNQANEAREICLGEGFWPRSNEHDGHPYFIIGGPADDGKWLVINLTDANKKSERVGENPCVVRRGEHPYIVKDSAPNFTRGERKELAGEDLWKLKKNRHPQAKWLPALSAPVLARLQKAARESVHMDKRTLNKYRL